VYEGFEGGPANGAIWGRRLLRRKTKTATNMNTQAAPPIAIPAIGPGASPELDGAELGDVVGVAVTVSVEPVGGGVDDAAEEEPVDDGRLMPLGPRSTYASQSALGAARGQLLA
jgi:hypothetical protein